MRVTSILKLERGLKILIEDLVIPFSYPSPIPILILIHFLSLLVNTDAPRKKNRCRRKSLKRRAIISLPRW
jgi:hypothetical protein